MADPQDDAPPDYSRFPVANHRTVLECDSVEQMNTDQYFLSEGITVLPPVRPRFDGPGSPHVSPRTRSLRRPRDRISPTLISLTESGRPRNVTISTTTTNNEDGRTLTCCRRARAKVFRMLTSNVFATICLLIFIIWRVSRQKDAFTKDSQT